MKGRKIKKSHSRGGMVVVLILFSEQNASKKNLFCLSIYLEVFFLFIDPKLCHFYFLPTILRITLESSCMLGIDRNEWKRKDWKRNVGREREDCWNEEKSSHPISHWIVIEFLNISLFFPFSVTSFLILSSHSIWNPIQIDNDSKGDSKYYTLEWREIRLILWTQLYLFYSFPVLLFSFFLFLVLEHYYLPTDYKILSIHSPYFNLLRANSFLRLFYSFSFLPSSKYTRVLNQLKQHCSVQLGSFIK